MSAAAPAGVRWHAATVGETREALGADLEQGLPGEEAARRLERHGRNELPESESRSLAAVLAGQFKSPLIYLLLVAAAIAAALGERVDAAVICAVVLLNVVIGAFQEGRAERALAALRRMSEHKARVLRDGHEVVVEARDVVPGDVILLAAGDAVPADARLVEGVALEIAEAALTGESVPVEKDPVPVSDDTALADRRDMVFSGTYVTAGRGRAIVTATGEETEIGRIAEMAGSAVESKTPLERRIDQFGRYVIAAAIVVFLAIVGLGRLRGVAFAEIFMIGVSAIVGIIPEGLPVAMTIALAVGVQRMARRNAVVRRLSAVETLGSTTVICTDKTGTLTRNEMTVTEMQLPDGREISVSGVGYAPEGELRIAGQPLDAGNLDAARRLLEAGVLCNDAELNPPGSDGTWKPVGDPTEIALVTAAAKGGVDARALRAQWRRSAELPFDPAHKMMAVEVTSPERGSLVVVKGAPEAVLELCALDAGARQALRTAADAMASRALRVLAIAAVRDTRLDVEKDFAQLDGHAALLGLVGQFDPPRVEVADSVKACRAAGIRPVVVTGDHKATALAVARDLGIAGEGDAAIDGVELAKLSDPELDARLARISVFARVHPAQKLRIIEAYQRGGEVVAMTGDGVNDAPALVRADVGVAMGITGTEVAKDAAKIVIADDNFATIVAAIEEGRVVYRNIKKAVLLLFSTSAAEVAILLLVMLAGFPPPFAAVQILWNNLVTEGVITVNLIMEPAEGNEMQRPPISPTEPLLTRLLLKRMGLMVPSIVVSTLGWFIVRIEAGVPFAQVQTETFTLLAICEWYNTLNCRSAHASALSFSLLKNPWLLGGLALGNLLQLAVVFWRPLGDVLHTVPFGVREFLALAVVGSLVLWVEEIRKLFLRRRERMGAIAPALRRTAP